LAHGDRSSAHLALSTKCEYGIVMSRGAPLTVPGEEKFAISQRMILKGTVSFASCA
jgi:hypothetical protein